MYLKKFSSDSWPFSFSLFYFKFINSYSNSCFIFLRSYFLSRFFAKFNYLLLYIDFIRKLMCILCKVDTSITFRNKFFSAILSDVLNSRQKSFNSFINVMAVVWVRWTWSNAFKCVSICFKLVDQSLFVIQTFLVPH